MGNWDDDVEDVNGFSRRSFNIMLVVGWLTFLMSGVFNFGYYKVHPRFYTLSNFMFLVHYCFVSVVWIAVLMTWSRR